MSARDVAVVVVNYGSSALLASNLATITYGHLDHRVVVVDNPTSGAERRAVRALGEEHGWTVVETPENLGFGGAVNVGAAAAWAAGASDLLVINPDAWIDETSVLMLAEATQEDRLLLVSPVVRSPEGKVWFAGLDLYLRDGSVKGRRRRENHPGEVREEWLSGACLWITREVWDLVGGFDDRYFLYWEDVDYSHRALVAGARLRVIEDATAVHDEGMTSREGDQRHEAKSETYYYYNIRNRMVFAAQHLSADDVRRWRAGMVPHAWSVLLRGGRRQFARPVRPLRAAWRGLRDGRRAARAALARPSSA